MTSPAHTGPATRPPRTRIIVVAYNSGANLQRCLDALGAQSDQDFELIVYDNASSDGAAVDARLPARARLVVARENTGFAGGVNRAAAGAETRYLALVNPDAFAEPDWLERLVAAMQSRDDLAAVGSLQLLESDPTRLDGMGDVVHAAGMAYRGGYGQSAPPLEERALGEVFSPCAAAALYRRDVFEALGGLDERFFCYCEDWDFAYRVRRAGWRCALEPAAVVAHVGSATKGRHSAFVLFHGARNRLWALVKNTPGVLAPVVALYHTAALAALLVQWLVRSPASAGHIARGTWVGLRGIAPVLAQRRSVRLARAGRPPASAWHIARALTWSPLALVRRSADVRPLPDARGDVAPNLHVTGTSGDASGGAT